MLASQNALETASKSLVAILRDSLRFTQRTFFEGFLITLVGVAVFTLPLSIAAKDMAEKLTENGRPVVEYENYANLSTNFGNTSFSNASSFSRVPRSTAGIVPYVDVDVVDVGRWSDHDFDALDGDPVVVGMPIVMTRAVVHYLQW